MDLRYYNDYLIEELANQRDVLLKQIAGIPMYPITDENLNRIKTLIIKQAQLCQTIESLKPLANSFISKHNLPLPKYVL